MMKTTVAGMMSALQMQIDNLKEANRTSDDVYASAKTRLEKLCADFLPSGSGIDTGTKVREISDERIDLECGFHHMNDSGMYDGWTSHRIVVRCGFYLGITCTISGPNRNEIKDYLAETYQYALSRIVTWDDAAQRFIQPEDTNV